MKHLITIITAAFLTTAHAAPVSLFDGKTLDGWSGDTAKTWRIEDGCITGGSLDEKVPHNEFLSAKKTYKNFDLTLKFKLTGTEGFVNSGVQFRSIRLEKPAYEMFGYQADIGDPTWWGCLYDESRRKKVLAKSDMDAVNKVLHRNDWNDYRIRCEGQRIQIWLNGVQTVDYTEEEKDIAEEGLIAVQIHGGAKAVVFFKDIAIEELRRYYSQVTVEYVPPSGAEAKAAIQAQLPKGDSSVTLTQQKNAGLFEIGVYDPDPQAAADRANALAVAVRTKLDGKASGAKFKIWEKAQPGLYPEK